MTLENLKIDFSEHVKNLQNKITQELLKIDPDLKLVEEEWTRFDHQNNPGGGGNTRAFQGNIIENAGVNFSKIYGAIDPNFAKQLKGNADNMWATGISLIIHPRNPKVPTVHANFRLLHQGETYWLGGGADLTPFYPFEEDFRYFHDVWKKACAPYNCYEWMKKECDEYFVNFHRGREMRGIGGIFFDHFNSGDFNKDIEMVKSISNHFIESYFPIVKKRLHEPYSKEDEEFQLFRRGRYVEFNLLHDRGTLFGLRTNGRVDSILISLPHRCEFTYKYAPKAGTPQAKMMEYYFPQAW
jgi:coproporphyrinogen III oxidase